MVRVSILTLFTALALGGCGSSSGVTGDAGAVFVSCDTETRATPYQPGMQVTSAATPPVFMIKLLESNPGPPVKGTNTWDIEVDEAATGTPLDGLDINVTPWMPDHGHGTSMPVVVTPTGSGGRYTLAPVFLRMSGFWQVKLTIVGTMVGAGVTDNATLPICIP